MVELKACNFVPYTQTAIVVAKAGASHTGHQDVDCDVAAVPGHHPGDRNGGAAVFPSADVERDGRRPEHAGRAHRRQPRPEAADAANGVEAQRQRDHRRRPRVLGRCAALPGHDDRPVRRHRPFDLPFHRRRASSSPSARFDPTGEASNAAHRDYIRDTISTRQAVISEPFVTNVGDSNMVLVATAPVVDKDGHMIAILTGSLGLTRPGMLGKIAKTVIGKTGYLYIVTADGKLIMHPDRERLSQRAFAAAGQSAVRPCARGLRRNRGGAGLGRSRGDRHLQAGSVVELDRRRRLSERRGVRWRSTN